MMKKHVLAQFINYCPQLRLHASKDCKVSWSIDIIAVPVQCTFQQSNRNDDLTICTCLVVENHA